ncbi:MAG: hypothetical protein HZC42_13775 [Candidatus Eisenbacteria bacterium]|nr:hypothetical protein [Candidatus Eisenbacteria bacterium]
MSDRAIDPILLGHNQFFGVNHLEAGAGNESAIYFSDVQRILDVVRFARENGVNAMMLSTHERASALAGEFRKDPSLQRDFGVYLLIPYVAKYVKQANEKGLVNVVTDALGGSSLVEKLGTLWSGGIGALTGDATRILTALVDFEVGQFRDLCLRSIVLHDVLADLALGLDMPEVFATFDRHVRERYGALPGYGTKNLPRMVAMLERAGIRNPFVMAALNRKGFWVNPSLASCEETLRTRPVRLLAMSTLAAGYLAPAQAYEYLYSLPNVESVVVGVSSRPHAVETFGVIRRELEKRAARA